MEHELTIVVDKIENLKCKTHSKIAEIKVVSGRIEINSCCKEHEKFLERKIEYEMHMLLNDKTRARNLDIPKASSINYANNNPSISNHRVLC